MSKGARCVSPEHQPLTRVSIFTEGTINNQLTGAFLNKDVNNMIYFVQMVAFGETCIVDAQSLSDFSADKRLF